MQEVQISDNFAKLSESLSSKRATDRTAKRTRIEEGELGEGPGRRVRKLKFGDEASDSLGSSRRLHQSLNTPKTFKIPSSYGERMGKWRESWNRTLWMGNLTGRQS